MSDLERDIKTQSTISDIIDLYDEDVAVLGEIWTDMQTRFSRKANSMENLAELEKRTVDECFKAGLVVRVHTSECLMGIGPVTIEPVGRVNALHDGFYDHERKRSEVLLSKDKGEEFLGQKEKHNL